MNNIFKFVFDERKNKLEKTHNKNRVVTILSDENIVYSMSHIKNKAVSNIYPK